MIPKLINNRLYIFLGLLLTIYTVVLLFLAKNTVTWEDEVYTLHTTSQDLITTIKESYNFEGQPPVYFGLLNLWRNFSDTLFTARLFSILLILLSGLLVFKICSIYFNREVTIFSVILFLTNPVIVGISIDARPYSLIIFLSLLSIYLYYKAYLSEPDIKIYRSLHAIVSLLSVFTQYLFVFLLISQALNLLVTRKIKHFRVFLIIHILIALIFSVNLFFIPSHVEIHQGLNNFDLEYFKTSIAPIQNFIFPLNPFKLLTWLYIIWLFLFIIKKKHLLKSVSIFTPVFFLLVISVITFLSILILFSVSKMTFYSRYLTLIFPLIFVIFIFSLTIQTRRYFLLWIMLLYSCNLIRCINYYSDLVYDRDYEKTAEFIQDNLKSNAPIIFYRHNHSLPFKYYYSKNNRIVQLLSPSYLFPSADENYTITNWESLNKVFSMHLISYEEFIYVTDMHDKNNTPIPGDELINNYISTKFFVPLDTIVMGRAKIYGLRIRRLIRKESQVNVENNGDFNIKDTFFIKK